MKKLVIHEYQAKQIEDTLRMVANVLESYSKKTCVDRNVMQSWDMIKNVIAEEPEKQSPYI